jgi:aminopeptidase N
MEYPMFVMVHYANEAQGAFGTIDHEHGHEWFPMIVGSNERRYAWMDEGFNTYINAFSNERREAGSSAWPMYVRNWRDARDRGISSPLMTPPDRIDRAALGAIAYRKPGAVLLALRNHVVGRETFDAAFREYVRRWAFRHPTPGDFFRTVENYAGEDLSWYWRGFLYSDDVLDIGIDGVEMTAVGGEPIARVALRRHTSIPFPVTLRLRLEDGSTMEARLPVQIWSGGDRHVAEIGVRGRVVGARLWPDPSVPDWNAANDTWGDAPPADPIGPVTMAEEAKPE